jgi:hypothetical protein
MKTMDAWGLPPQLALDFNPQLEASRLNLLPLRKPQTKPPEGASWSCTCLWPLANQLVYLNYYSTNLSLLSLWKWKLSEKAIKHYAAKTPHVNTFTILDIRVTQKQLFDLLILHPACHFRCWKWGCTSLGHHEQTFHCFRLVIRAEVALFRFEFSWDIEVNKFHLDFREIIIYWGYHDIIVIQISVTHRDFLRM